MMATKATPVMYRNVVVLRKTGAGKSSVANNIMTDKGQAPPFTVSTSTKSETKDANMTQTVLTDEAGTRLCYIKMVDTIGFFETGGRITNKEVLKSIKSYFKENVPEGVSLVIFVFKKTRYTQEEKDTFDFIIKNFQKDISHISALVVTCCEDMTEAGRQAYITDLQKNKETQKMVQFMSKGVFPVGFPSLDDKRPVLKPIYEGIIAEDTEKLRQLVFSCTEMYLSKEIWEESFWERCKIL